MSDTAITEEDINLIKYFIKHKGDINCWIDWEEKRDAIAKLYPELTDALQQVSRANDYLEMVLNGLEVKA